MRERNVQESRKSDFAPLQLSIFFIMFLHSVHARLAKPAKTNNREMSLVIFYHAVPTGTVDFRGLQPQR